MRWLVRREKEATGSKLSLLNVSLKFLGQREICPLAEATSRFHAGPFAARCIGAIDWLHIVRG